MGTLESPRDVRGVGRKGGEGPEGGGFTGRADPPLNLQPVHDPAEDDLRETAQDGDHPSPFDVNPLSAGPYGTRGPEVSVRGESSAPPIRKEGKNPRERRIAMARCQGVTRSGDRCKREAQPDSEFCHLHGAEAAEDASPTADQAAASQPAEWEAYVPLFIGLIAAGLMVLGLGRLGRWIPRI